MTVPFRARGHILSTQSSKSSVRRSLAKSRKKSLCNGEGCRYRRWAVFLAKSEATTRQPFQALPFQPKQQLPTIIFESLFLPASSSSYEQQDICETFANTAQVLNGLSVPNKFFLTTFRHATPQSMTIIIRKLDVRRTLRA
ncbi:unnamed protein product [Umbelopsis ramanniana]